MATQGGAGPPLQMIARWTRSIVLALCLFVLPTSASAECAWVLWVRATSNPTSGPTPIWTPWKPTSGDARQPDCYAFAKREATRYHNRIYGEMFESFGIYTTMQGTDKERWQGSVQLTCLPDTVSPKD
jgi:hypothetical protein